MALTPRRWSLRTLVLGVAVLLVAVGGISFVARQLSDPPVCGAEQVESARTPLQSAEVMTQRPSEDRDRLAAALGAMGPPFGPVVAGRDYYYDQFLRLYGVPGGILAWTKNSAPVTFLDDQTLAPRWSLRPTASRTAWDVSPEKFVLLDLAEEAPLTIAAFDLADGDQAWCVEVDAAHRDGEPVATAFLDDGDVLAALPSGDEIAVLRLAGADGEQDWSRRVSTAARADYLGQLDERLLVVGGVEESRLTDPAAATGAAPAGLTAIDLETGNPAWTWDDGPGSVLHVVGIRDRKVLALVRNTRGTELVTLSATGAEVRRTTLPAGAREATLRGSVLVVRGTAGLTGYAAATGRVLWSRAIPTDRPYVPLGFSLAQMPSVDADHLLLPTVSSLELLDLTDGTSTSYRMPTDGLSSAYFPYQLLVTGRHLGAVTNTGTVLVTRE